ncbi:MAG: hypothetical protein GC131_09030 [Alphaproteobacteria bacterium]|nr:hypothetical protein [Alphaproteobacteria bacterium]
MANVNFRSFVRSYRAPRSGRRYLPRSRSGAEADSLEAVAARLERQLTQQVLRNVSRQIFDGALGGGVSQGVARGNSARPFTGAAETVLGGLLGLPRGQNWLAQGQVIGNLYRSLQQSFRWL